MNERKKLLGYYNYTVVLTYIGMLTAFAGIIYIYTDNVFGALVCLMTAGFCDMFDGAIASTKQRTAQEKCFGIQIDSLSDLISFGVLPSLIVYSQNKNSAAVLIVCSLYVLCALIRLAYFNVDEQDRQQKSSSSREIYYGMPVTLSAVFLPVAYGSAELLGLKPTIMTVSLLTMAILFLLPFPLRKPKLVGKICVILCGILEIGLMIFVFYGVR